MTASPISILLLFCSTAADTMPPLPLPVPLSTGEIINTDTLEFITKTDSDTLPPIDTPTAAPVDSVIDTGSADAMYPIHQLLTSEGLNIESAESDVIDELSDEEPLSVLLIRDESTGIGSLIPGSILTTVGILLVGFSLIEYSSDPTFTRVDHIMFLSGSIPFCIGGFITTSVGAGKLSKYIRSHCRYAPSAAR